MPEMEGRELARRVSESRPSTPVLLMSGYPDPPGSSPGEIDGTRFLQKPFQPAILLDKVRELLVKNG